MRSCGSCGSGPLYYFSQIINWLTKVSEQSPGYNTRTDDRDTEKRILDAAGKVFVRRGTAGARMQEIAAEAGVNQALLHYYFRSKEGLAAAVFREAAGRLLPAVTALLDSEASLETKVERFVQLYIDTVREQPFLPGYVLAEMHHHPERLTPLREISSVQAPQAGREMYERIAKELEKAADAGTIRRIPPEQFVVNVVALCVFPFAARPALDAALGLNDEAFAKFLDERRRELPCFILNALRP